MSRLLNLIKKDKFVLLAELAETNPEIFEAAAAGGADAIQIIVKNDPAKELKQIHALMSKSKVPLGIVLGKEINIQSHELKEIEKMGFDFINIGIEHLTPAFIGRHKITKVITLDSRFSYDEVLEISKKNFEVLDAAIIPVSKKGKSLDVGDLQNYISIIISSGLPVLIPTQCRIHPSEVAIVSDAGAKGLILTSLVTGNTAAHIAKTVEEYRAAVDELAVRGEA